MKNLWAMGIFLILGILVGCSQTVSPSDDEENSSSLAKSSDANKYSASVSSDSKDSKNSSTSVSSDSKDSKNSSSSISESSSSIKVDPVEDNCVGTPGKPWDGTTAKTFACGSGTKLSPYIILNGEQLARLSFCINASDSDCKDKYFKLGADILLNEGELVNDKGALVGDSTKLHKWTPIGNSSVAFSGNFDGADHTISGMFINTTSTHNGLFGNVSGTVQNLAVENSWVMGGKYTAAIVGDNEGTIENAKNSSSVTATDECVGGVVGRSHYKSYQYNSVLKNLFNEGIIVGKNNVGGVAGCATYVTIDRLENTATIEGYAYVAGVIGGVGSSSKNDIQNLKNSGSINGSHFVAGVAGHCGGSPSSYSSDNTSSFYCGSLYCGTIKNAKNEGNITGVRYVGGILGGVCYGTISNLGNSGIIIGEYGTGGIASSVSHSTTTSLYNTGDIHGDTYVGGIMGYNEEGVTSAAYSTGIVDGDSLVGLMIGYNYNTTMADYYYLEQGAQEPFGLNNGGGVATPKNEPEMKSSAFTELLGEGFIYESGLNDGWPILNWENE